MTDSKWTHPICKPCWDELDINMGNLGTEPVMLRHFREVCCFCGHLTTDGIYTHANGITLQCKGQRTTVEPSTGLHIIGINGPGIMTTDYETGKPIAMWIATLANEDTAFLSLDMPVLEALGSDMVMVETLIKSLAERRTPEHTSLPVAGTGTSEPGDTDSRDRATGELGGTVTDGYAQ